MSDLDAAIRAKLDEWQQFRRQDGAIAEGYGYDEMAAAIVAVLDRHKPAGDEHFAASFAGCCAVCGTYYEYPVAYRCPTVRAIAEKLGVEVDRG